MNVTRALTKVKLKLGLMNIASPIEDLDNVIIKTILNEITIPVFSHYYPAKDKMVINLDDLQRIQKTESFAEYLLPDFKTRKLINVLDVKYDESTMSGLGFYGTGFPLITGSMITQSLLSNASANLGNQLIPKMTFKYIHPRRLFIYNAYNSFRCVFDLGFEHDKSLASIPDTAEDSFYQLFLLDVKENLYPTFKHFSTINTAYGNVDLKIDDWANAEAERNDLIAKWDDTYQFDNAEPLYYG